MVYLHQVRRARSTYCARLENRRRIGQIRDEVISNCRSVSLPGIGEEPAATARHSAGGQAFSCSHRHSGWQGHRVPLASAPAGPVIPRRQTFSSQ